MHKLRIHDGSQPETPLFHVYLGAVKGPRAEKISVQAESRPFEFGKAHRASDVAIEKAIRHTGAPESAFCAVYIDNPTPDVSGAYGAPMGRVSGNMDFDAPHWRAQRVRLDAGGYDRGGAYWGLRPAGVHLYAVQDGMGNVTFADASSSSDAIAQIKESE